MIDKKILNSLGFSDNESMIYELLLQEGEIGVGQLQKLVTLRRATLYNILESLKSKKIIDEGVYHGKKTFIPKSPLVLENMMQEKINNLKTEQSKLKVIIPEIMLNYKLTNKTPLITSYKGIEGLSKIYDHILKVRKPILIFASFYDRNKPEFSKLINEQIKHQGRLGIKSRVLGSIKEYSKKYYEFAKDNKVEIKVPRTKNPFDVQIIIYGNNVAMTDFRDEYISTLISNPAIARSMEQLFEIAWHDAEVPIVINRPMQNKENNSQKIRIRIL